MKIAEKIKDLNDFQGVASLYKLSEPIKGYSFDDSATPSYEYVIASAVYAYSGPETYLFGASAEGVVLEWCELPGSYRGGLDHREALDNAGYKIGKLSELSI